MPRMQPGGRSVFGSGVAGGLMLGGWMTGEERMIYQKSMDASCTRRACGDAEGIMGGSKGF
jgi:hypothetical protein